MKRTTLKTRLWALAATLLLLVSLLALPVSAANAPVAGGTFDFNKYLVMDENANVPNVTFEFTIDAGTAVAATGSSPAIYAGIVEKTGGKVTKPTVTNATFSYNTDKDSTTDGLPTDTTTTTTPNMKYATKEVTVNFSGISFTAPGIYRYTITEVAPTQSGIAIQGTGTRTLDVYVEYKNNGSEQAPVYSDTELVVSHYVLHEGAGNPDSATKSPGFTNTYTTYDLTLAKTVTGNQGDRDKYFVFSVNITGAVNGTVYTVDLSGADERPTVNGVQRTNPETLTVDDQGSVTATYYLKHGQSIVIQGLTEDTNYTITETSYSTDGYTTSNTVKVGEGQAVTSQEALTTGETTMGEGDNVVTFTNDKQGTVPTGILLETAPYLILGAVVVAGLVVLFATRRRRSRE